MLIIIVLLYLIIKDETDQGSLITLLILGVFVIIFNPLLVLLYVCDKRKYAKLLAKPVDNITNNFTFSEEKF